MGVLPLQSLPLRAAAGRILRQAVLAERDIPPFDRVCMDGVAIGSRAFEGGTRRFRLQATQGAGARPLTLDADDAAIEVMTGAVLPHGADCIVPLEEYALQDGALHMTTQASAGLWRNVQRRGTESRPGASLLVPGTRLGAAEIAVVASAGLADIQVSRQPRVAVVSTGDELVEPGAAIADHQVRRSNAFAVAAALKLHGFSDVQDEHLADSEALMRERLGILLGSHDVLVLSGGVSKGKFDYVPTALKALGVSEIFYQVAQRPGRPMWFGVGPEQQLVFGLPGNPVSTLLCLIRYVMPALQAATGAALLPVECVELAEDLPGRKMTYFMPVSLQPPAAARRQAQAHATQGSGDFLALAGTDGFVELPPQPAGYARGTVASFYRW